MSNRIDLLVQQYVKIREALAAYDKKMEAGRKEYLEIKDLLKGKIIAFLQETGQDSAKTEFGTAYLSSRDTASLADAQAFMDYVIQSERWELLDRRANATACRAFIESSGDGMAPPGVNFSSEKTVGVRKK